MACWGRLWSSASRKVSGNLGRLNHASMMVRRLIIIPRKKRKSFVRLCSLYIISQRRFLYGNNRDRSRSPDDDNDDNDNFLVNVFNGNTEWLTNNVTSDYVELTSSTPRPQSVVVSCCDSRAPVQVLGKNILKSSFAVRNIGNQYSNACGSTHFGLDVLKTPFAIIMGHTNCAAIKAAAHSDYNFHHTIVQEVACLVRVLQIADKLIDSNPNINKSILTDDVKMNIYSEINVDFQIQTLLEDINLSRKVNNGDLTVIGIMFDIHNIYNKGYGRLHITNINGETDIEWLKNHRLLSQFNDNEKDIFLTRLLHRKQN